jgi:uncharacterized membrane protein YjgN (DUF898 family)
VVEVLQLKEQEMETINTPAPEEQPRLEMRQLGNLGDLFLIHLVNTALKWVTLSIYHFWGKTRIREYLWSHQSLEGDRFEYTGTGGNLFVGFLKAAIVVILLLILALALYLGTEGPVGLLFISSTLLVYLVSQFLAAVAGYTARGYLLSRTRWRSIRFGQGGSAVGYAVRAMGLGFIVILTLGLYWPYRRHILLSYKINRTHFGTTPFAYNGSGGELFGQFLLSYLLTIPTLGLIWFWYGAREAAYVAAHTQREDLKFTIGYTWGQLFWLRSGNFLISIVTFGLGYPWVILRNFRFLFTHLEIRGEIDYESILQSQEAAPSSGEGLAEIFGMSGSFLGLGRI